MKIISLKKENILVPEFENLNENNIIEFSESGIAIVYGPNGTGKTTFLQILSQENNCQFEIEHEGLKYNDNSEDSIFHSIKDQNGRNIIEGEIQDFILGDNIRREYEIKKQIEDGFEALYNSQLIPALKKDFGIAKKKSNLHAKVENQKIVEYSSDLANNRSKGKIIGREEFLHFIQNLKLIKIDEYDEEKLNFLVQDSLLTVSIIEKVLNLENNHIKKNPGIRKIEESSVAIEILETFDYLDDCIVCDRDINRLKLLEKKKRKQESIIEKIDETTRDLIENLINQIPEQDPFDFSRKLKDSIIHGNFKIITDLKKEIFVYYKIYNEEINNFFTGCLDDSILPDIYSEYSKLKKEKQIFTHEDALYIEKFVNESIDRPIELKRDENGNLRLLLGDQEFLHKDRQHLGLSNGEQNFISLAFELLKAQKVDKKIIILDDPISSFDSIYKNKISYAIIKFLSAKHQIILTHSMELVRLLEHQKNNCYNLYIMNNTSGEVNGFVKIEKNEQEFLLYLSKFLDYLRGTINGDILNKELFLISLIPFMRGYAQIIGNVEIKNQLTTVMHVISDN